MKCRVIAVGVSLSCVAGYAMAAADYSTMQKKLGIPSSIGRVVDASGQEPEFILIQDIHRHPEVQANIAALLLHAYHRWGLTTAYLEGAYAGQAVSRNSSEVPLRTQLSEGTLSGAEMASAMVKAGDFQLEGLDNVDAYKENVAAYQEAQEQLSQALQEIKTVRLLQQTWDLTQQRFTDEQLDRLELLARLKLKPSEYAGYLKDRETQPIPPVLAKTLEAADRFYQLADERSAIFPKACPYQIPGPKALIIGGFHTAALAEQLREAGKSFVVLAPCVTRSGYEHLYAERMSETISALNLH